MKKIFALLTVLLLLPALNSNARSWYGGPFGNQSPNATGDDGVYEAVATMTNGVGLYRWAVRNNPNFIQDPAGGTTTNVEFGAIVGVEQTSGHVWYYKGLTYYGTAFGVVNSGLGVVSCIGNAVGNVTISVIGGGGAGSSLDLISNPTGGNVGVANSSFIAKITDKFPQLRFSGKGQVSFVGDLDQITRTDIITVEGSVGAGDDDGTTTETTDNPSPNTTVTTTVTVTNSQESSSELQVDSTGGEDPDFPQRGHVRKFVVIGSQVSYEIAP